MAVPTTIADLSATAASNSPAGTDSIGTSLDDFLRSIQAIIKQGVSKGSDITAASTIACANTASYFVVTGTTGITAIANADWEGRIVVLKFSDVVTITHSAGLILPGASNITTTAGDVLSFVYESAGVWRGINTAGYLRTDGASVMAGTLKMGANGIEFEGSSSDAYKTTLNVINPTADRTINLPDASGTVALTVSMASGMRNKIVNGCGYINQQVTDIYTINSTANTYGPDKWCAFGQSADGVFSFGGIKAGFVGAPAVTSYENGKGFQSVIWMKTTTADASIAAAQRYGICHAIEAQHIDEWRIGGANAATVKLRFAVWSTVAGTHCVAIQGVASTKSFVATYTITDASTWEEKEISIPLADAEIPTTPNGIGLQLIWLVGAGSNFVAPNANTWETGNYLSVAGCVNLIGTLNAQFAITDVELKKETDSDEYEHHDYQTTLQMCQREYCKTFPMGTAPAQNAGAEGAMNGVNDGITANGYVELCWQYPVRMRAEPTTVTTYNPGAANSNWSSGDAATVGSSTNDRHAYVFSTNTTASNTPSIHIVADARL